MFEKNGGEFNSETHRYRSNDMVIQCRNGINAISKFIADVQQTCRHRSIIIDGLYAESLEESRFDRDTLIIGETTFECVQWQEALKWTGQVKCILKKNQTLTDTPITIITKKLMNNYPLSGYYYRVLAPFGLKHRLKCMYNYSMSDYCFKENQFIFNEPYAVRNITYYEALFRHLGIARNIDDYFCSICLEMHDKVYRFRPCKHTLCLTCYDHANIVKCHMCRGAVNWIEILYDEEKTIPPPATQSILFSLYHLNPIVFSTYIAGEKDTFEKVYTRYMKNPNILHHCQWPKNRVSRTYGKKLQDLIFIITEYDPFPDKSVIDSLCVNDINLHVLYSSQKMKEQWENVLSTTG